MKQDNLETVVETFTEKTNFLNRNASFDYCFNYRTLNKQSPHELNIRLYSLQLA